MDRVNSVRILHIELIPVESEDIEFRDIVDYCFLIQKF